MTETYHTPAQVADRLRVSRRTVYRWLNEEKTLRGVKAGRAGWRITETELRRFMRPREHKRE